MGAQVCSNVKVNHQQHKINIQPVLKPYKRNVLIKSKVANKVFDVCQDKGAQGTLIINDDYKKLNQRFDILKASEEVYYFVNKKSEKYLTIGSNSQKNYALVLEEPISAIKGQKFRLQHIEGNEYFIHTFCGKALSLNEKETSNGTKVIQYDYTRENQQKWIIQ